MMTTTTVALPGDAGSAVCARFCATRSSLSLARCSWPVCLTTRGTELVVPMPGRKLMTYTDAATFAATASPAATYAATPAPLPDIEHVFPAPVATHVVPALVFEYVVPAPCERDSTCSDFWLLPAYTMTTVNPGVSFDIACLVSPQLSSAAVEASAPQVVVSLPPFEEFTAPLYNQVHQE